MFNFSLILFVAIHFQVFLKISAENEEIPADFLQTVISIRTHTDELLNAHQEIQTKIDNVLKETDQKNYSKIKELQVKLSENSKKLAETLNGPEINRTYINVDKNLTQLLQRTKTHVEKVVQCAQKLEVDEINESNFDNSLIVCLWDVSKENTLQHTSLTRTMSKYTGYLKSMSVNGIQQCRDETDSEKCLNVIIDKNTELLTEVRDKTEELTNKLAENVNGGEKCFKNKIEEVENGFLTDKHFDVKKCK